MTTGPFGGPPPAFTSSSAIGEPPQISLVAPWIHPDERLHAVLHVHLCGMIRNGVPRKYRLVKASSPDPTGPLDKAVTAVLWPLMILFNLGEAVSELAGAGTYAFLRALVMPLRGRPFRGGWRSQAGQFVIAVRTGPSYRKGYDNANTLMVFTDRRLLLVHDGRGRGAELLGEFGRKQLHHAGVRHWFFSKRVDLHFSDGSLAALEVSALQAEALRALARGELPAPGPTA